MHRKWTALAGAMTAFIALAAGFSLADEDSELHKLMEQVNMKNAAITKAVRTPVQFKKAQQDQSIAKNAEALARLAEDTKTPKYQGDVQKVVKKAKDVPNGSAKWNALMDDFIKTSKSLADLAGKSGTTAEEAKESHKAVKKSCSNCHEVFRIEDE